MAALLPWLGVMGLWNHQNPKYARWAELGWLGVIGLIVLVFHMMGTSA